MSDVKPFPFEIAPIKQGASYCGCGVYAAQVSVGIAIRYGVIIQHDRAYIGFCRICLKRMRATLKAAEKALPPLPKRVRPTE